MRVCDATRAVWCLGDKRPRSAQRSSQEGGSTLVTGRSVWDSKNLQNVTALPVHIPPPPPQRPGKAQVHGSLEGSMDSTHLTYLSRFVVF